MAGKLTPYQEDLLEIYRRIAQRGKRICEDAPVRGRKDPDVQSNLELWIHLLDELERFKK